LRPAVELNECVEQTYLSIKSMIRRLKIIVKKNEIKKKKINNERIATLQMKNKAPVKRKRTFRSKRRNK